jgi:ATP-binding cassette subfamily B protein/ATP-binding cassette subfamily C protein/ATP-binding cassette subfamily C protein LapB
MNQIETVQKHSSAEEIDWMPALKWFCQHFDVGSDPANLCFGLPIPAPYRLNNPSFLRVAESSGFDIYQFECNEQIASLSPVLVVQSEKIAILREVNGDLADIVDPLNDHVQQVPFSDLIGLPCIQLSREKVTDARSEEHFENKPKSWIKRAIEEVRPWYRDLLIGSCIVNLLALIVPLFTMNVYDRVVPNAAFDTLWVLASGVIIVIIFDWLLRSARTQIGDTAGKQIDRKLSSLMFANIMGMKLENRPKSAAAFSKQVQEFDGVREFFTSATLVSAIDLPFTIFFIAIIAWLGGWMALIPLCIMIALGLLAWMTKKPLNHAMDESSKLSTQRSAHLIEQLNLLPEIKQQNGEALATAKWEQIVAVMSDWSLRSKGLSQRVSHSIVSTQQITTVALIIAGVYQIFAGNLSMGGLIAVVMLSGRASNSINQIALLMLRYHQCKQGIDSLENIMNLPQEKAKPSSSQLGNFDGAIQLEQVSFVYPDSEMKVLQDISLQIKAGMKLGLVGRAGAGKSSLLGLLAGQYEVNDGSISYDGVESSWWPKSRIRARTGYVGQTPVLQFGSIMDNLTVGANTIEKNHLGEAIHHSGMGSFVSYLEQGLETQVGEMGRYLSGGQRQAVTLARAMLRNPSLLLLDEPTSQMDQQMKLVVKNYLEGVEQTVVLSSHDPELLNLCDELIVLERGKIISRGKPEKILGSKTAGRAPRAGKVTSVKMKRVDQELREIKPMASKKLSSQDEDHE